MLTFYGLSFTPRSCAQTGLHASPPSPEPKMAYMHSFWVLCPNLSSCNPSGSCAQTGLHASVLGPALKLAYMHSFWVLFLNWPTHILSKSGAIGKSKNNKRKEEGSKSPIRKRRNKTNRYKRKWESYNEVIKKRKELGEESNQVEIPKKDNDNSKEGEKEREHDSNLCINCAVNKRCLI